MIKRESKAQINWGKCVRAMDLKGAFELKATKDTFNLFNFEPQQISSLQSIEDNGLVWKIADTDMRIKPCDMIATVPLPAYVVIYFEQERKYVMIRIEDFVNYRETSKKKSGSFKDMEKIAERIIELSTGL